MDSALAHNIIVGGHTDSASAPALPPLEREGQHGQRKRPTHSSPDCVTTSTQPLSLQIMIGFDFVTYATYGFD